MDLVISTNFFEEVVILMSNLRRTLIVLLLIIGVLGLFSFAFADSVYSIKPFESARIKTSVNLSKNPKYLSGIKVAYDKDGEALEDDVKLSYDKKNPAMLIVTPMSAGWRPENTYYVIAGSNPKKVYQFRTKAYEYKTISGMAKLEQGQKAFEDIEIWVQATTFDDTTSYFTAKTKILKGKDSTTYTIKVPANLTGYSLSYDIIGREDKDFINSEYYITPGYVSKSNMTSSFDERKRIHVSGNMKQDITIITDKIILKKAKEILAEVIKPGMTDYEKEVEIYKYVIKNIEYDQVAYEDFAHRDAYLYAGLINNKTWCVGYASIMKLLLNMVDVECDIISSLYRLNAAEGHAWNVVKIDGDYFHLDATSRSMSCLNFSDDHTYIKYGYQKKNTEYNCNSYEYNYDFRTCWVNNKIKIGSIDEIQGRIYLPQGQIAPAGGMPVRISAYSGQNLEDTQDDFKNTVYAMVPEGENSVEYSIKVIPTLKSYTFTYYANTGRMLYKQVESSDLSKIKNQDIKLETLSNINVKLSLPEDVKVLPSDMQLTVYSMYDDGSAQGFKNELIFSRKIATIPAGERTAEVSLAIDQNKGPYVIYYIISDKDSYANYEGDGFYSDDATSADYKHAAKLMLGDEDKDIKLVLRTKK